MATLIETGTLHFSITGEFVTQQARDWVLEDRWRAALELLMEGLQGMDQETAFQILRGEKALAGTNAEVHLVDGDQAEADEYRAALAYHFGGLLYDPQAKAWFRPYAYVGAYGPDDLPSWEAPPERTPFKRQRALYYATDRERDQVHFLDAPGWDGRMGVLFGEVKDPPLWMKGHRDAQQALDEYLAADGATLERRGYEGDCVPRAAQHATLGILADLSGPLVEDLDEDEGPLELDGLGMHALRGMALAGILGHNDTDLDEPPVEDTEFHHGSGYVLPDGRFYGCGYMGHHTLSPRILRHVLGREDVTEDTDGEIEADKLNWLRIQESAMAPGRVNYLSPRGRLTKRQERTLDRYCTKWNREYPAHLLGE